MKAIVNINRSSSYAHLNGHSFEVVDFMPNDQRGTVNFGLSIDGHTTDFTGKEVIVQDLQQELQKVVDNMAWNSCTSVARQYRALINYTLMNGIKVEMPTARVYA